MCGYICRDNSYGYSNVNYKMDFRKIIGYDEDNMISCKEYHDKVLLSLKDIVKGKKITIIQVGDNAASNSYVKYKTKDCIECGIVVNLLKMPEDSESFAIYNAVKGENRSDSCGIIVQLPLPAGVKNYITGEVAPEKDIDGFIDSSKFAPCTAKGIMDWLKENKYNFDGKVVTLIGRGKTAGSPLIDMLKKKNVTLICCNSYTNKEMLIDSCKKSDMIICATGVPGIVTSDMVSENTLCIDVGRGDFTEDVANIDGVYLTPKIGGVGLLTRAALIQNISMANGE